jgi:hypothetical protein
LDTLLDLVPITKFTSPIEALGYPGLMRLLEALGWSFVACQMSIDYDIGNERRGCELGICGLEEYTGIDVNKKIDYN